MDREVTVVQVTLKTTDDAIYIEQPDMTKVFSHLFDECQIDVHYLPPDAYQDWRFYTQIEEIIYVVNGKMVCKYYEDNFKSEVIINSGDVLQVQNCIHTFVNPFEEECEFVVFRFVLDGINKKDLMKYDKVSVKLPKE